MDHSTSEEYSNDTDLNVPVPVPQTVQPELVRDFSRVHGVWQVLLIGEYEKDGLSQLVLGQHPHQLVPSLPDTLAAQRDNAQRGTWFE